MKDYSKLKKALGHLVLLAFACHVSLGQDREVVLPSPETAALFRYQEYPMDHSTGLAQISIPLFTLKNGSLSVPISISYHASGFKVSEVDGPIAAGWSLNTGGMVSRTIHGDPDFGTWPFPHPFDPAFSDPNTNMLQVLEQVTHYPDNPDLVGTGEFKDSQYDIFSYSFAGHGGKFIFKDSAGVKTPVVLNQKPLRIFPVTDTSGIHTVKITDDRGDNYTFVGKENEKTTTYNYTGFALKKILSANQRDSIVYTYNPNTSAQYRRFISQTETLMDRWPFPHPEGSPWPFLGPVTEPNNEGHYDINRIMEIDFEQGTLEFVLVGGSGADKDLIDYIQLKDRNGKLIRKVKFQRDSLHSILGASGTTNLQTHKLTGIEVQDQNSTVVEHYAFDHYPTTYSSSAAPGIIDSRFIDYWGYYNASGETYMIPKHDNLEFEYFQIDNVSTYSLGNPAYNFRAPSLAGLQSGVLRKIYYPTGGSTEFVYEHNKYQDSETGIPQNGPGLRVKEIINSDGTGNTVNRTFTYSNTIGQNTGYGDIDMEPKLDYMYTVQYSKSAANAQDHRLRTFFSGFVPSLSELASRPIRYTYVTEYKGSITDNVGKTVYEYDNDKWEAKGLPPAISGEKINHHVQNYRYWDTPMLEHQTDYKAVRDGNGTITAYDEKRKINNVYSANESFNIKGLHVQRNYVFPDGPTVPDPNNPGNHIPIEELYYDAAHPVYAHNPYTVSVGTKNLSSTTEVLTNDDGSTVTTTTDYTYNTNNYVSEVETEVSRTQGTALENLVHKKEITYPFDYTGTTVLETMVTYNMLQHKVEEKDYLDGQLTGSSKVNYKDWTGLGGLIIQPDTLFAAKGNDVLEPKMVFHEYDDQGNPLDVQRADAPHTFYIWGYHQTVPIAKIDNFTDSQASGIQSLIDAAMTASDADDDNCRDANCKEQELRDALALIQGNAALDGAQMSYFTYDPLIGATSMTDPRGYTVYYHYDAFNRLKEVRDAEGNLVSDNEYSYKQPVSN